VDIPRYPVFLFAGVLPWLWVSTSVTAGSTSIVDGASLVTRACVPPQVLPAVTVLANLVNLVLSLPVAVGAAAIAGVAPSAGLLLLPLAVAAALPFVYGTALACAALCVRWRDVRFLVQSGVLLWFFLTPVVVPLGRLPDRWARWIAWNPASGLVVPFQEAIHAGGVPGLGPIGVAGAWSLATAVAGAWLAERVRGSLAERL
jgi:lipopolysaccharide transport system permease protein